MDLTNYQLIQSEVKHIRNLSKDDKEDLVQDVYLRLLEGADRAAYRKRAWGEDSREPAVNRKYIRKLIRNILASRERADSRRPKVIYSSGLADSLLEKGRGVNGEE